MSVEAIPVSAETDPGWRLSALCAQIGGDSHFAEKGATDVVRAAQAICARCPVTRECLADALAYEAQPGTVRWGIRAGTTPKARQRIAQGRAAA